MTILLGSAGVPLSAASGVSPDRLAQPLVIPGAYCHNEDPSPILKYAKARGFTAVNFSELLSAMKGEFTLPPKPFTMSFDDEPSLWASSTDAALATYGMKATGFLSTGYPDGEVMDGGTDPYFYTNTSPITWDQLRTLKATGRWDFQNHTRNHFSISSLDSAGRTAQWNYSQARIFAELGVTPKVFLHPKDAASLVTVDEAFAFGFELVVIGPQGLVNAIYGIKNLHPPTLNSNRSKNKGRVFWRQNPGSTMSLEQVWEPVGNRIPDSPLRDNSLSVWRVPSGSGVEANPTNGCRFGDTAGNDAIDLHADGSTAKVTAELTQMIATKPGEWLHFGYKRNVSVGAGTFNATLKEYDHLGTFLRDVVIDTVTGTSTLSNFEVDYQAATDAMFVRLQYNLVSPPSGSFAVLYTPFLGATRG